MSRLSSFEVLRCRADGRSVGWFAGTFRSANACRAATGNRLARTTRRRAIRWGSTDVTGVVGQAWTRSRTLTRAKCAAYSPDHLPLSLDGDSWRKLQQQQRWVLALERSAQSGCGGECN
eukprot:1006567-Rhodomonas_salina.1